MQSRPLFTGVLVALIIAALGGSIFIARRIVSDVGTAESSPKPPPVAEAVAVPRATPPKPAAAPRADPARAASAATPQAQWKQKINAGLSAYRDKRPADALALYNEAMKDAERSGSRPAVAVVLSYTGSLLWSMRRLDEAEVQLMRAIELNSQLDDAEILRDLGTIEGGNLKERTERMLSVVYRDMGKPREAAVHREAADRHKK